MKNKILKNSISIIGSRGIPNNYGGFEKFTEILSKSLVQRGFQVRVSCEKSRNKLDVTNYCGVKLFYFPITPPKSGFLRNIYEFIYDVYSLWIASKKSDVVYMLGYSAAFLFCIPKIFGKKLWVNPDGIEWKRSKFNPIIKFILKLSERIAVFWADEIIADSYEIKKYLDSQYNVNTKYISYGAQEVPEKIWDKQKLPHIIKDKNNLKNRYWLVVARLEPENNIHLIIEAYTKSDIKKPLIVIGNFSSPKYESIIRNMLNHDDKVMFLGGIYDLSLLNMLRQNCFAYIHGHSVGGTNPSLLEIMTMKSIILAHDNEFNREVCQDTALYFDDGNSLKDAMEMINEDIEHFIELKEKAYQRVIKGYSWKGILYEYEKLLGGVL